MGVPLLGQGFHTFRRSTATIAYDANLCFTYGYQDAWFEQ